MIHHIKASSKTKLELREFWNFRDLLLMLAYRDFKVRYAQTSLGMLWAFTQPLITLLIFILVFNNVIKVETGNIPYPIFALTGMLAWNYFTFVLSQSGNSIVGAQAIITKIYFPRLIIPISKALLGLIDFFITLFLLSLVILYYEYEIPAQKIIYLPLFLILLFVFANASGVFFSALTTRYRDVQYIIPFIVQIGLYLSPIAYPSSMISEKWRFLYFFNPISVIVESFRWCIGGTTALQLHHIITAIIFSFVFLLFSLFYFKRVEAIMPDII